MCRFGAYYGQPILIADLLYRPRHSLVRQSKRAEQMSQTFNADGFGVGFFTGGIAEPCIVRSTMPAWSNHGLESLAHRLRSARIFAHLRASSRGVAGQAPGLQDGSSDAISCWADQAGFPALSTLA